MWEHIQAFHAGIQDPLGNTVKGDAGDIAHCLLRHPALEGRVDWLVDTIRDPEQVYVDRNDGRKLIYGRTVTGKTGQMKRIMVVVKRERSNAYRLKTAMVPRLSYWNRQIGRRVWPNA